MKFKYLLKAVLITLIINLLYVNNLLSQWNQCSGKYGTLSAKEIIEVDNFLLASTNSGIIKSNDGKHWDEITNFTFPINELYNYNKIIFGVFGYNALKVTYSKDLGETWKMLNTDTLVSSQY